MPDTRWLVKAIQDNVPGDVLEFGIGRGTSFIDAINTLNSYGLFKEKRLFGFDSFKGLPEESPGVPTHSDWVPGWYEIDRKLVDGKVQPLLGAYKIPSDRVVIIEGFFRDTLNRETKTKHNLAKVCYVLVDSDLYISAVQVLDFIRDLLIPGSIVLFDNWGGALPGYGGEMRAFLEFQERNPDLIFEFLARGDVKQGQAVVRFGGRRNEM